MNPITLLNAYIRAEDSKRFIRDIRGSHWGIAVAKDHRAIEWQRRDRQAQKFRWKLAAWITRESNR